MNQNVSTNTKETFTTSQLLVSLNLTNFSEKKYLIKGNEHDLNNKAIW